VIAVLHTSINYFNAPQGAMPHGLLIFWVAFSPLSRTKQPKKSSLFLKAKSKAKAVGSVIAINQH